MEPDLKKKHNTPRRDAKGRSRKRDASYREIIAIRFLKMT